jgi:hypothetical protein
MKKLFDIKNPQEYNMYRNETGQVHTAGSMIFDNSTGTERVSLTHQSGSTIVMANQSTSLFNPNDLQSKTNGNGNDEVEGDRTFYTGKRFENRVGGDFIVVTGTNNLYDRDSKVLEDYIKLQGEIAAAQVAPAQAVGGISNNTRAVYAREGGEVDKDSGSTDGQKFKQTEAYKNINDFVVSKTSDLTKLEMQLGEGGNISLISGKDVHIQAGTKPVSYDSGFRNPNGLKINSGYKFNADDKKLEPTSASAPTYQEVDTFSQIPFGNLSFIGNKKITFGSGAGGIDLFGSGSMKFVGTGLTVVGGSQVNITANGSTFINTSFLEANTNNFNVRSPKTFFDGNVDVKEDVIINGNLFVGKNLRVLGDIIVEGKITAEGDIVAGGSGGISLLNHVHRANQENQDTNKPK